MSFAENVYRIMKNKKMKQADVARAAGMTPKDFNALLCGRRLLREEHVNPICRALDITPNDLFREESHRDIKPIYMWGNAYSKLTVVDTAREAELAVITEDDIDTASPDIVVKLTPKYD